MSYLEKEVNRLVGQAIHRYHLLEDGDRIMAAVSGGADSMLCLWFLRHWLRKAPISYDIIPVHLDMGYEAGEWKKLTAYLRRLGYTFHVEETRYGIIAHGPENRGKSPCFICSMNRRKRLFELADALGCNKIAMGHNADDLIETFFMNVCYVGEMSTMVPRQEMFQGLITIIRPLALVEKPKIKKMVQRLRLPVITNRCPSADHSRRSDIRDMLEELYSSNRKIRGNIKRALGNVRKEYLL